MASEAGDLESDPAVRAAIARGEAALARESGSSAFEGIELRARGMSADRFRNGEDFEFSARLEMRNPFEVASERRARRAETDIALAGLEGTTLEVRAERCRISVTAAAAQERRGAYQWYRERLESVLAWNDQRRTAGTVDELRAQRLRLEGSSRLADREPRPLDGVAVGEFPLPAIAVPAQPLSLDHGVVIERILRNQPSLAARRATKRRYEAYAQRANRRRLPWFGFVEVAYEVASPNTFSNVTGQVAFEVPFGAEHRAEARRYEALGRSEELDTEALEIELGRLALMALREIAFYEERTAQLSSLLEESRAAQQIADRWLTERIGDPAQVAQLIDEAFRAHESVVDSRRRAGLAGCMLLETTGVAVADWPRGESR